MTEAEWLACEDPEPMVVFLFDKVSQRKLRLFAVGCCRQIRDNRCHDFDDPLCWNAIEVSERFADQAASRDDLKAARRVVQRLRRLARRQVDTLDARRIDRTLEDTVRLAANTEYWYALDQSQGAQLALVASALKISYRELRKLSEGHSHHQGDHALEPKKRCMLIRDLFFGHLDEHGSFKKRDWRTSTVTSIGRTIYTDRAFDRLPILGDALEDAGCTDRAILDHCRQPGEHVRGCWVVDLVLAKE